MHFFSVHYDKPCIPLEQISYNHLSHGYGLSPDIDATQSDGHVSQAEQTESLPVSEFEPYEGFEFVDDGKDEFVEDLHEDLQHYSQHVDNQKVDDLHEHLNDFNEEAPGENDYFDTELNHPVTLTTLH